MTWWTISVGITHIMDSRDAYCSWVTINVASATLIVHMNNKRCNRNAYCPLWWISVAVATLIHMDNKRRVDNKRRCNGYCHHGIPNTNRTFRSRQGVHFDGLFAWGLSGSRRFAPRTFRTQDVSPRDVLDLDVSLPDISDQDVSPPNILDQDVSSPDNCFIIQNICFSWKFSHLGEFTSNFSWRCFTPIMALRQGLCDITWRLLSTTEFP